MKKYLKILYILLIVMVLNLFLIETASADELSIDAKSYILMDMDTGEIIISKNKDTKAYPASTTKIMTGILSIENSNLSDEYTASQTAINDIGIGGMNIGISPGEVMTNKDLLHAMLISSANETANILSENVFQSKDIFIKEMNNKLIQLNLTHTHFTNPIGLDDENHYTTANDLGYIAKYAMENKTFAEIVGKQTYDLPETNMHKTWDSLWVSNKLFLFPSDQYNKVLGIKTGHTNLAGYNLVSAAENSEGLRLLAVVMGIEGDELSAFYETKKLLEYGFSNYAYQVVAKPNEFKATYDVIDAENSQSVDLETAEGFQILLPKDKTKWNLEIKRNVNDYIKAPINSGTKLGELEFYQNGVLIKSIELIASNSVGISNKAALREKTSSFLSSKKLRNIVIISLCALFILALIRLFFKKVIYKRRRRKNFHNHW